MDSRTWARFRQNERDWDKHLNQLEEAKAEATCATVLRYDNERLKATNDELLKSLRFMVDAANTEPEMAIYKAHIAQAEDIIRRAS